MKYILFSLAFLMNSTSTMSHTCSKQEEKAIYKQKQIQARSYVWNNLMTQDQREAWCKESYDAHPRQVEAVTISWSMLLANHLAQIGMIENSESAIAAKAQRLFNDQWELLEKVYRHESASAPHEK